MKHIVNDIISELKNLSKYINNDELETVATSLCYAKKEGRCIFLAGAGRSGCVVKGFTNRLMHLGFECFLVGDITTPPIKEGDILFILSGSGKTTSLVNMAKQAKNAKADIMTITLQKDGEIGTMAKDVIVLPGTTRLQDKEKFSSIQPVGSSFEQLSWITCDGLVMIIKEQLNLSNDDLIRNHGNLE